MFLSFFYLLFEICLNIFCAVLHQKNYNGENNDNSYRMGKLGCVILEIIN